MGDGTVNVGLGMLNSSKAFGKTDYRALLRTWLDGTPEEWGLREENAIGPIGGAGLPMGFNRTPHYRRGMLLVGDAGGAVNPFNGEGIAYAMESAAIARRVRDPGARPADGASRGDGAGGLPGGDEAGSSARYYRLGGALLHADRQPDGDGASRPGSACPAGPDVLRAEAAGGPVRPEDGATSDRVITAWRGSLRACDRVRAPSSRTDEVRLAWLRPGGSRDLGSRRRPDSRDTG